MQLPELAPWLSGMAILSSDANVGGLSGPLRHQCICLWLCLFAPSVPTLEIQGQVAYLLAKIC